MKKFIRKYSAILLLVLPTTVIMGLIFQPFALVLGTIYGLIFMAAGKKGSLIFFFLTVLILGDTYIPAFEFFKTLKISLLVILTIWTFTELIQKRVKWNKGFFWVIPFFILSIVALVMNAPHKFMALQKTISYLFVILVCYHLIMPWLVKKEENASELIHFFGLILLIGLTIFMISPSSVALGNRYQGIFGNPNGLGLACMVWTPYLYAAYKKGWKFRKWGFFALFLLISLLLSQSRNSLAGVAMFFLFLYILRTKTRRRIVFWGIPIIYLVVSSVDWAGLIQMIGLGDYLRIEGIETASGRTMSWAYALLKIPENFWFGGGFTYTEYVYHEIIPPEFDAFRQMSSTWNSYLTLLLNNGLIGTIAFLTFVFAQVKYSKDKWMAFAYILAMLLGAVFETWLTASLNSFTIYFYIMVAYLQQKSPFS